MLIAAIAHGHVLVEGPPGSAKTLLGRAMAHVLGAAFKRIQFTPDTTATDIIGEYVIASRRAVFMPGPLFTNVVLADEINRTPPRDAGALLEGMQERHVTVDGEHAPAARPLPRRRDAEPVRAGRRLPTPGVPARPFPLQGRPRIRLARARDRHAAPAAHRRRADMLGEIRPLLGTVGLDRARKELDSRVADDAVLTYIVGARPAHSDDARRPPRASSRAAIHLRRLEGECARPGSLTTSRSRTCARWPRTSSATA